MNIHHAKQSVWRTLNRVASVVESKTERRIDPPAYIPTSPQSVRGSDAQLAMVTGPFSYRDWCATFGDTEAMHVVTEWPSEAGIPFDIACHPCNGLSALDINGIDANPYTIFIYVCGPWDDQRKSLLLPRFAHCVKIGVNISVLNPEDHGFDLLLPRDAAGLSIPDVVFATKPVEPRPLIGLSLVHAQPEYGTRQRHERVEEAVNAYLSTGESVALPIDTLHVDNRTSTRTAAQLESLVRRLDVVITTRLHGLVFSLRSGTPVVAIDPVAGGGKVTAQARAVGWPLVLDGENVDAAAIGRAVGQCLDDAVKDSVARSQALACERLREVRDRFLKVLPCAGIAAPVSRLESRPAPGEEAASNG
jgi:hypothetical protein